MLGRSVTFGPKYVEKCPQQGMFFELTTPNIGHFSNSKPKPIDLPFQNHYQNNTDNFENSRFQNQN